jgi:hypothetical protein
MFMDGFGIAVDGKSSFKEGCGMMDGTGEERKSEIFSPSGGGEKFLSESLLHARPTEPFPKEVLDYERCG